MNPSFAGRGGLPLFIARKGAHAVGDDRHFSLRQVGEMSDRARGFCKLTTGLGNISEPPMALTAGTRLGPYEIEGMLGVGGMGEVYRARDPRSDVMSRSKYSHGIFGQRRSPVSIRAGSPRGGGANHPNILAVYDLGTHAEAPFIVSELLEGQTLRDRLNSGPVVVRKAIEHALQIARGLQAAHEQGIIHRDLKPENVFMTRDGRIKILDFGLAKLTQDQPASATASALPTLPSPTQPGVVLGTVGYMAPEQVRGLAVDHRADLFLSAPSCTNCCRASARFVATRPRRR